MSVPLCVLVFVCTEDLGWGFGSVVWCVVKNLCCIAGGPVYVQ